MLVIHGLWAYGAVYLWAEDSALPATAPPRPGRLPRPQAASVRPADVGPGASAQRAARAGRWPGGARGRRRADAVAAIRRGGAARVARADPAAQGASGRTGRATGGRTGSGGLGGPGPGEPVSRRASLAAWRVPALAFEPAAAVGLLAVLDEPGAIAAEIMGGGSAHYLAAVARLAADLRARGRVLPALRCEDGGHAARWRPVLSGADAERAHELATGMPALCRATNAGGQSSAVILTDALDALTDAAARARLSGQPLLPPRKGRGPPASR